MIAQGSLERKQPSKGKNAQKIFSKKKHGAKNMTSWKEKNVIATREN